MCLCVYQFLPVLVCKQLPLPNCTLTELKINVHFSPNLIKEQIWKESLSLRLESERLDKNFSCDQPFPTQTVVQMCKMCILLPNKIKSYVNYVQLIYCVSCPANRLCSQKCCRVQTAAEWFIFCTKYVCVYHKAYPLKKAFKSLPADKQ